MLGTRPLTFITGIALLGLGGVLIARSFGTKPSERNPDAGVPYGTGERIEKIFIVERPADDLYAAWRDLAQLPSIMSHLERVEEIDGTLSRWTAKGTAGFGAAWDAEIIDDTPGRRIAWRSINGNVPNAGSVAFNDLDGGRTELRLAMEWAPPAGPVGTSFAHLFGDDPDRMVEEDLRRFKSVMENREPAREGSDANR